MIEDDPFPDLPYDDDDIPDRGITAREALVHLLDNEHMLSEEQWDFVSGCAGFITLSEKQERALINTWQHFEVKIALRRAKLHRKKRRRASEGSSGR